MPQAVEFPAPYDRTTKIVSAVSCVVLLFLAVAARSTAVAVMGALIVALAYAWSPRGYAVGGGAVVVKRLAGSARFALGGVREARCAGADDVRGAIRLWGSGGMFGYYGWFRTSALGVCRWYVTDRRKIVVVIGAKTALFSPADPDGFLAAISAAAPQIQASGGASGSLPTPYDGRNPVGMWIGIGIAVAALAAVAAALLYSPGPPRYTLTRDALTVHDRFYPVTLRAADVDAAGIRVVDIRLDAEWRPAARVNGFANAHYHSGWFRVAGGRRVRLYRADATRLVLLPPKGNSAPVLLQVADPDRFADELRTLWGANRGYGAPRGFRRWAMFRSSRTVRQLRMVAGTPRHLSTAATSLERPMPSGACR